MLHLAPKATVNFIFDRMFFASRKASVENWGIHYSKTILQRFSNDNARPAQETTYRSAQKKMPARLVDSCINCEPLSVLVLMKSRIYDNFACVMQKKRERNGGRDVKSSRQSAVQRAVGAFYLFSPRLRLDALICPRFRGTDR